MECVALESKHQQVRCLKAEGQNSREEKPTMQNDANAQSDADASHRIMASWEKLKMVINFTPSQDVADATILKDVVSSLVTRVAQKVENGESDSCDKDVGSASVSKRPVLASFTDMDRKQVFDNIDYQQTESIICLRSILMNCTTGHHICQPKTGIQGVTYLILGPRVGSMTWKMGSVFLTAWNTECNIKTRSILCQESALRIYCVSSFCHQLFPSTFHISIQSKCQSQPKW